MRIEKSEVSLTQDMLESIIQVSLASDNKGILGGVCLVFNESHLAIAATDGKMLVEHKYECITAINKKIIVDIKDKKTMGLIKLLAKNKGTTTNLCLETEVTEYKNNYTKAATLNGNSIEFNRDTNYPAYENAIAFSPNYMPDSSANGCFFGVSSKYLALLDKALGMDRLSKGVLIYPQGAGKGVIIKPLIESHAAKRIALIMTIRLH